MIETHYSSKQQKSNTCFDLFCGAGGLSLGFCQAGGKTVAAIDCDHDSIETYRRMFGGLGADIQCGKIEDWKPNYKGKVDIIIGGPPCQGFSNAGKRFLDDPRNILYKYFVKTVELYQPEWIVMENVPGIISFNGGKVLESIYQNFNDIGYTLSHKVINMAEYGVPQARKRTIFVGNRLNKIFEWPKPTRQKYKGDACFDAEKHFRTVKMALGDLNYPAGNYFSHRANSQMRGPRNRDVNFYPAFTLRVRGDEFALCSEPATGAFAPGPLPSEPLSYGKTTNDYQEYLRECAPSWADSPTPAPTVEKTVPALKGTRKLTIIEQSRLQSFPDWFSFEGVPYSQSRQIGNAVPPLFAKVLFEQIFTQMES